MRSLEQCMHYCHITHKKPLLIDEVDGSFPTNHDFSEEDLLIPPADGMVCC
jgi:hypothetical protein